MNYIWRGLSGIRHAVEARSFDQPHLHVDRLVGLVVKASTSRAEDPGFESRWWQDFFGSSRTSDLNIGTPVATLPGAWRFRVSAGTGQPGVSILWLDEVESLTCSFYLSVAARTIVWADPSLRYTSLLLGRSATNTKHLHVVLSDQCSRERIELKWFCQANFNVGLHADICRLISFKPGCGDGHN